MRSSNNQPAPAGHDRPAYPAAPPQGKTATGAPRLATRAAAAALVAGLAAAACTGQATTPPPSAATTAKPTATPATQPGNTPPGASWRVMMTVQGTQAGSPSFSAITATEAASAWAFASALSAPPAAWRLKGAAWAQVPFPGQAGDRVVAAGSSVAGDVWAFDTAALAGHSAAVRWDGRRWTVVGQFRHAIGGALVAGPADVWIFGEPYAPGAGLGTWHYDGRTWRQYPAVPGLLAASAVSPGDIWAAGGKTVAHWDGSTWTATSLAGVLPADTFFCRPGADHVYARADTDVWVAAAGHCQDRSGPFILLHFDGARWQRLALLAQYGEPVQVVPDGSGGLWIPTEAGTPPVLTMLHYTGGQLRPAPMPLSGVRLRVESVANAPGSTVTFAGGWAYPPAGPDSTQTSAVLLEYGP